MQSFSKIYQWEVSQLQLSSYGFKTNSEIQNTMLVFILRKEICGAENKLVSKNGQ